MVENHEVTVSIYILNLPNTVLHPSIPACSTCSFSSLYIVGLSLPTAHLSSHLGMTLVFFLPSLYFTTVLSPCEYSFLLLAVIYLSFISLGLPDSLLGSAWPTMYGELGVPVSYAGIISMIIAAGTIVSSLQSDRLTRKPGTGMVTALSVGTTAAALFGFSVSHSFWALCLWAPLWPRGRQCGCGAE